MTKKEAEKQELLNKTSEEKEIEEEIENIEEQQESKHATTKSHKNQLNNV